MNERKPGTRRSAVGGRVSGEGEGSGAGQPESVT